jgi:Rrf2 family protein
MKRDSRLSIALHILSHLAVAGGRPIISENMAAHLGTNPVVVRRSLAGLREAGIVASVKGHGGGWTLARPADTITLGEVYAVLGDAAEFLPPVHAHPAGCHVDAVVRGALNGFYEEANALLRRRLDAVTLADIATRSSERGAGEHVGDDLSA